MKPLSFKFLSASLFLMVLAGCNSKPSQDVKKAVEANQNAKNLQEYENSPDHPEQVLARWRSNKDVTSQEVCRALTSLPSYQLMVFSHELEEEANAALLRDCKEILQSNLQSYHASLKSSQFYKTSDLDGSKNNIDFKIPFEIQKRDLSNGYRAVTGDVKPGQLILTFDDGPHSQNTLSVLATLAAAGVKGMFFQVGKHVEMHPEVTQLVAREGHRVGSHSYSHPCLGGESACGRANGGRLFSPSEGISQIRRAHQAIYNALGFVDPFFRFPYGASTPELHGFLKDSKMGVFAWNIDSEDWKMVESNGRPRTNLAVIQSSLKQIDQNRRGIILFHDIHRRTADLLPEFLSQVHMRGYKIVMIVPTDENLRYNSPMVVKKP